MSEIVLKETTANLIRKQAEQRGYDNPEEYLLDLVEADAKLQEEAEFTNEEIRQNFKRAFKQALQGKVISQEEFERRMAEDD